MMDFCSIDFETRSTVDLRRAGVYIYAEDPTTDIWCMAYSFDGSDEVGLWLPGEKPPAPVCAYVREGGTLRAWNSGFEYRIWGDILAPRYGFPTPHVRQWVDTAAEAAAMALPRSLGNAARVLGMEQQKDDAGYKLMMKMAKPRAVGAWWYRVEGGMTQNVGPFPTKKAADDDRKAQGWSPSCTHFWKDEDTVLWWDEDPQMLADLGAYCVQDVRTEKEMAYLLRDLPSSERAVFLMNQRMNDRGVPVDVELVEASKEVLGFAMDEANQRLRDITQDSVGKVTEVGNIATWLGSRGLTLPDLKKDTVRDTLSNETLTLPDDVREVLQIRQDAGKTSTAKLDAFLRCTGADGRARGLLLYHGASTGRWAGRLIQPQNFPRPDVRDVEQYIPLILARDIEGLRKAPDSIPNIIASLLRSMFRATPNQRFLCGDYSQIEARVLAWIAGQDDLVQLFRDGGKVYETMAAFIFQKLVEDIAKDSFERQIGKNSVLGAGFQMGADRFAEQVREQTGIILDRDRRWYCEPCDDLHEWHVDDDSDACPGCAKKMRVIQGPNDMAAKAITGYRTLYSMIPQFWEDINAAAIKAVRYPGQVFEVGHSPTPIRYMVAGKFLYCRLPSGRFLTYADPQLRERALPEPYQHIIKEGLTYLGVDSTTGQWRRHHTYGGHLTENVVQAMARDLMAGGMLRLQSRGYNPILTVHDEAMSELPYGQGSLEEFMSILTTIPKWAEGVPLAGEGWEGERYRK